MKFSLHSMTVWISCIVILMPLLGEAEIASARSGPAQEIWRVHAADNPKEVEALEGASASPGATRDLTDGISPIHRPTEGLKSTVQRALLVEGPNVEVDESDETESATLLHLGYVLSRRPLGRISTSRLLPSSAAVPGEHVCRGPPSA